MSKYVYEKRRNEGGERKKPKGSNNPIASESNSSNIMRILTLCYLRILILMIVLVESRRRFLSCSLSLDRRKSHINVGVFPRVMSLINHRRNQGRKSHRLLRRRCRKKRRKREDKEGRSRKRQESLDIARLSELKLRKKILSKDW